MPDDYLLDIDGDGGVGEAEDGGHSGSEPPPSLPEAPRSAFDSIRGRWLPYGLLVLILLLLLLCLVLVLGPGRRLLTPPPTATATEIVNKPPTDAPTATMTATPELTETSTPETGNGACSAACDPANSNCLAGLACLPVADTSGRYVCWNDAICQPTKPPATEAATQPPAQCSAGWLPAAGCVCCGTTKVCADGTVATFNPACGTGGCSCVCILRDCPTCGCLQWQNTCTGQTGSRSVCP